MMNKNKLQFTLFVFFALAIAKTSNAQSILPPVNEWKGKSELLIVKPDNLWITPTEKSDFRTTPTYKETMSWLKKLADTSPLLIMVDIGNSPEGRDIYMIIASQEKVLTTDALKKSTKPLLLVQAGIHAGEIDGKDAGMMLLRDIALGNKKYLLDKVNLLFIPILNVDGHERISSYNRPNQRGPENMGYRTNSQNLNLNRDYCKIDTKEIRAVINVINTYDPVLYMDIHVTDGADYQYDITFGGYEKQGYSPAIAKWLATKYKPLADNDLTANGHVPGQLIFAVNDMDFTQGTALSMGEPRFSDAYGNLRHLPTILVENHSLKPFKQRVLGTYILLESTMNILAVQGQELKKSIAIDKAQRNAKIPMSWKIPQMKDGVAFDAHTNLENSFDPIAAPDSLIFLGIESKLNKSQITNSEYVEWTGKPITSKIANYKGTEAIDYVTRPKAYWVPASCYDVIERLKLHGIKMEIITEPREVTIEMYRIKDAKFQNDGGKTLPFEGHIQVKCATSVEIQKQKFEAGSACILTDQPLGDLAMFLLEPKSPDSYFSWGFFYQVFQRTEYIEAYVMEPTMKKMLDESPELKNEFEQKKTQDTLFAKDPYAIYNWFYSKTKYYDSRYLLYPVGREM